MAEGATGPGEAAATRVAILVLGMHRSGTSALTRLFSLLGAALPRDILGSNHSNPEGHWEPQKLIELHDAMLAEAGGSWDDWRAFDPAGLSGARFAHYKAEICRIIADQYGAAPLIVLKEPRICRFAGLYIELLGSLGFEVRVVHCRRNPLAVISSLAKRDAFAPAFTGLLWLRHELDAEAESRGHLRVMISYEGLLESWRGTVASIEGALKLAWPRPLDLAAPEIEAFVSRDHQHFAPKADELALSRDVSPWMRAAFEALVRLEADEADEAARRSLDAVKAEFDAASQIFGPAFYPELQRRNRHLRARYAQLEDAWRKARANSDALGEQAKLREAHVATLTHGAAASNKVVLETAAALSRLAGDLESRSRQIEALQATLQQRDKEIQGLSATLAKAEARGVEADALRVSADGRRAETARLEEALAAAEARLRAHQLTSRGNATPNEALRAELASSKSDASRLRAEVARLKDQVDAVYESTSWRVTRGLRFVKRSIERSARLFPPRGRHFVETMPEHLAAAPEREGRGVLLVTHSLFLGGAPLLLLEIGKALGQFGCRVCSLSLGPGALQRDFEALGNFFAAYEQPETVKRAYLERIFREGVTEALVSTVASGSEVRLLKEIGFTVVCLVHELPGVIEQMGLQRNATEIASLADKVVFPADMVREAFERFAHVPAARAAVRHQGVWRRNPFKEDKAAARAYVLDRHGLPNHSKIVLSIGFQQPRKGLDLLAAAARAIVAREPATIFIVIGQFESEAYEQQIRAKLDEDGVSKNFCFIEEERDLAAYYAAAAVYALPSREDPFPNVVIEAAEAGLRTVGFEGASGAGDFIRAHGGLLAKTLDPADFATKVCQLLDAAPPERVPPVRSIGQYVQDLLHEMNGFQRVSVVVPNYNYARYLRQRLETILAQRYPLYELVVLDDASTDNSIETLRDVLAAHPDIDVATMLNRTNSGSVFAQWQAGLSRCSGDLVWIAEADDYSDPGFLAAMAQGFQDKEVVLAYCQSHQVDEAGNVTAQHYLEYTGDVSSIWTEDYVRDGREEIGEAMTIKNVIPNVSAVLFRRSALIAALAELADRIAGFRLAGDWLVYIHVLRQGRVRFVSRALNYHRRHDNSVTTRTDAGMHLGEILEVQRIARAFSPPSPDAQKKADAHVAWLRSHLAHREEMKSAGRGAA